jgi:hypothetical protein
MGTNGSEPELGYRYRNDLGDTLVFTPAGDEAVVSFDPGATQETADALDGARPGAVRTVNPAVGFAIVRVRGADDTESLAAALESAADDASSMPVLLDGEGNRRYFLPDQLTVQFAEGVDDAAAREVIAGLGSEVVVAQRTPGYYTVSVPEGSDVFVAIRAYDERSDVAFAEPSEIGLDSELATTVSETEPGLAEPEDRTGDLPDDLDVDGTGLLDTEGGSDAEVVPGYADFSKLWGLFNHGQTVDGTTGTVDADIDGTIAWDIHQGRSNVVVAVIDTGADLDHPDLASQLLPRGTEDWDFAAPDGVPDDTNSHGTHVAGTAVGNQNGSGVSGVAPRCRLMPLRVNLTSGMNQNRADAINYVAARATANPGHR